MFCRGHWRLTTDFREFHVAAKFSSKTFAARASLRAQPLTCLSECEMEPQTITLDPATSPLGEWALLPAPLVDERAVDDIAIVENAAKTDGQECPSYRPDAEWLREVIVRWEGPLVRYAVRVAGDLDLGRDAVQETFLRLCRLNDDERSEVESHLARWLFSVCRSRALDVRRKESRMLAVMDLDERTSRDEVPPDELLERRETAGRLMSFLGHLPDNQQEVIRLKFQNDLSYREIADITGHSVSNIGFLLHTGIRRLREMMKDEG